MWCTKQEGWDIPQLHYTAIITTLAGLAGGLGKALAMKPLFASTTLFSLGTVAGYTALSAVVGYLVKYALDWVKERHLDNGLRYQVKV